MIEATRPNIGVIARGSRLVVTHSLLTLIAEAALDLWPSRPSPGLFASG
jgi:hypothetical protein